MKRIINQKTTIFFIVYLLSLFKHRQELTKNNEQDHNQSTILATGPGTGTLCTLYARWVPWAAFLTDAVPVKSICGPANGSASCLQQFFVTLLKKKK